jgi:hypothetical protein
MRWITLIGRLGTVILMTGLALGLVWLIPSAQTQSTYRTTSYVYPEKYSSFFSRTLTPQTGLHIAIESNGSLYVYILSIFENTIENWTMSWVKERFPSLNQLQIRSASTNVTVLNAVLESHSDIILWKSDATSEVSKEFYPTKVTDVIIVIANPSLSLVLAQLEFKAVTSLAPKARLLLSTQLLIPIGLVLAIPWIYFSRVRKSKS